MSDEKMYCTICGLPKNPIGRSAPLEMAISLCSSECPGYYAEPRPSHLWPGESELPTDGSLINTLTNACQIFDGWKATAPNEWSDFDEKTRMKMSEWLAYLHNHPDQNLEAQRGGTVTPDNKEKVCAEILDIMRVYHEQEKTAYGVDTPGGLENMDDVWQLFSEWEKLLGGNSDTEK